MLKHLLTDLFVIFPSNINKLMHQLTFRKSSALSVKDYCSLQEYTSRTRINLSPIMLFEHGFLTRASNSAAYRYKQNEFFTSPSELLLYVKRCEVSGDMVN